jgi:DNA-binding PadR family transcriptional regulator
MLYHSDIIEGGIHMAIQNKTRYAILGVLCIKSCTGYDIKKFCDKTISHFWNENFGHIYPVLKQLLEERLIAIADTEADDRRKLYTITEEGKQLFYHWLVQAPQITPPRSELLLKLSFGNYMPRENVKSLLLEVQERNLRNLENYRVMEASYLVDKAARKDPAFPYWLASLRLGIMNAETAVRWSQDTIELLESFSEIKQPEV